MRTLNTLFILLTLLLMLSFGALAQEDEATEEAPIVVEALSSDLVVVPTSDDVEASLELQFAALATVIIAAIWNLIYIPVAAPLVELLASVAKRLPFLSAVSAPTLAFTFTVAVWVAYVVVAQLGYGDRFDDMISAVTTLATMVFGIPVTQAAAKQIHGFAQANSIPIFGYSRTPSLPIAVRDTIAEAMRKALSQQEKQTVPVAETVARG